MSAIHSNKPSPKPIISTVYNSIPEHFNYISNEFQSNLASIRTTSRPGAALIGLGLEYPESWTSPNLAESTLDVGVRNHLYTPFSIPFPSNPTKRVCQQDSKGNSVLGLCSSACSPSADYAALPPGPLVSSPTNHVTGTEFFPNWSYYALSTASGLSPNVLATHIPASAEITLQLLSDNQHDIPYFGTTNDNQWEQLPAYPYSLACLPSPEMVPPIADINMRELRLANQGAILGVDPTATFLDYSNIPTTPVLPLPDCCRSPDSSFADAEDNDCDEDVHEPSFGDDTTEDRPTDGAQSQSIPGVATDNANEPPSLNADHDHSLSLTELLDEVEQEQGPREDYEPSEYEPSVLQSPPDQEYMPSPPNSKPRRVIKRTVTTNTEEFSERCFTQREKQDVNSNIDLGTPVINAHFGITLPDLQEKAERYRLRNNIPLAGEIELVYDKRWLLAFVGKLSQQGELIHEFRCYVIGCSQTNKRRDHILIHLGGHLGHRPFKCSECPSRFLRKNECKRHELSHKGARPFICHLCLIGFVRQDLLKRHVDRTHGSRTPSSKRKQDGIDSKRPIKKTKAR
ncbi:hypothetical protein F5887DRAFT_936130 [Amanita rubescens]|nr:hypothetical protein F5887DRAFT_936130 [Amanita rubescens]